MNLSKIEEKILRFWQKNKIVEKGLNRNKGKKNFVFFEGPPTANGRPGMHHVEARAFKDIIPRYKAMRGFFVDRKAGWDTHGLPVELEVEKELGFKNKDDIEKYGVAKFNQRCRKSVWRYKDEWEKLTKRIAFWIDTKDPYITYENHYIETVWYILKKVWDKGLLFKGFKIIHYCPRCETGLSSHEVAQGYRKVKENSVYLNFKVTKGNNKVKKNDIILAWTTTPWTLPGNVALAVGEDIVYVKIKYQGKKYILAKSRLGVIDGDYQIADEFKGKDLIDVEYQPLFEIKSVKKSGKKAHYVVPADFVSTEDGTGVVHTAVMYGEEDYELGKKLDLPMVHTVTDKGFFIKDLAPYGLLNKFVKDKEIEDKILTYLKDNKLLFKEEEYEHDYPFCWRCDTPLLYYAKDSWFIKMSKLRKNLVANNQKIFWEPAHIKKGRFGEFIKEARDWALSRERYWGTPLPVWQCQKCGQFKCIGSAKELGKKIKDLHRPYVDEVKLKCKCGGQMVRDKSVIDVWFDSGAMPFAQWGYPYQKDSKKRFKEHYPADYICEAVDQTRGWFYSLLAIATLMEYVGEIKQGHCFDNVICLGHVLDAQGKKMSKSKGNVVDPWEMCNQFGSDTLRWYLYTINQAGEPKRFNVKDIADKNRRFFGTLFNSFIFLQTYKDKGFRPRRIKSKHILDKWIISRFNALNEKVIKNLEKYDVVSAARLIENFVDEFSNWYIRRSRIRLQKPKDKKEQEEAAQILYKILIDLSKLIAPFTPFIADEIYQGLKTTRDPQSVHLCDYPKPNKKYFNPGLESKMEKVREIVALALAKRAETGIKVRQPLRKLTINNRQIASDNELTNLIKEEVNVKEVVFGKQIRLDTKITPQLRNEGMIRDLVRSVQGMRKDGGLKPKQKIYLRYSTTPSLRQLIQKNETEIKEEIAADKIEIGPKRKEVFLVEKEVNLDGQKIWLGMRRVGRIIKNKKS
jgi:isoleucyl-tRNA synthetase